MDLDWDLQTHHHSISGDTFIFYRGGISWSSQKQSIIIISTTKAAYIATFEAVCELLYLHNLILKILLPILHPITLFCDNQSIIQITNSGLDNAHTKYINS